MAPRPTVSAVLPAYNEVAVIADLAARTAAALQAAGVPDHEVIVVDDGSSDGTGAAVAALAAADPRVRLVTHPHNRGYGAALRSGFNAAKHQAVWLMDGDGQFDPADVTLLLDRWSRDTMVAGYRAQRQDPLSRRASNRAFFTVVRLVVGATTRDVNCAFKLFPRELATGLRCDGAMVSTELLLEVRSRGMRIVEVAVPHYPRLAGQATGANPAVVLRAFGELWQMLRARRGARTRW
jgi:glycosyltransferase involved in cell wall biosynthesis